MYKNLRWYAFFVKTGSEKHVYTYVNEILSRQNNIEFRLLIPSRKIIEYKAGIKKWVYKPLFPGYILIETNSISKINEVFHEHWPSYLFAILRKENYFEEIKPFEILPILNLLDFNGIIVDSTVFLEKDRIMITEGPLVNHAGEIIKINKRKGRAKIIIFLFNKNFEIDVGITCLKKIDIHDVKRTVFF